MLLGVWWTTSAGAEVVVQVDDEVIASKTGMGYNVGPYNTPWDGNLVTANIVDDSAFEDGPNTSENTAHRIFKGCSKGWHVDCWIDGFQLAPSIDSTTSVSGTHSQRIDIAAYSGEVRLETWPGAGAPQNHRHTLKAQLKRAANYSADVRFRVRTEKSGCIYSPYFSITTDWSDYSWTWTPSTQDRIYDVALCFYGTGTVWVDDFIAWDADNVSANGFPQTLVNRLKEVKSSMLRWGSLYVNPLTLSGSTFHPWGMEYGPPAKFGIPEFLDLCVDVGADAMITVPPNFSDDAHRDLSYSQGLANYYQEHLDLLDYVGGDTTTTWGGVRANQGLEPWDTRIQKIYFELGNEIWNSMSRPFNMGGSDYGDYCNRRSQAMRSHSTWKPNYRLGFGGHWASSNTQWGFDATVAAGCGQHIDFFTETVYYPWTPTYSGFTVADSDEIVYSALFATPLERYNAIPLRQQAVKSAAGKALEMIIYEANTEIHATNEWGWWREGQDPFFSKNHSIGAGTATLDLFAKIGSLGVKYYCWYQAVSKDIMGALISYPDFQPRVDFLAHVLLNNELGNSVLRTKTSGAATWNDTRLPLENVPYVEGYGYREGENAYSVLIVNRHRTDPQQISVRLPSRDFGSNATLVRFTSPNINDNNNAGPVVRIQKDTISGLTNPYTLDVPPFSAYILQVTAGGVSQTLPAVTMTVSPSGPGPNAAVTYSITYENSSDQPISSKSLRIPVPQYLTYVNGSASDGGQYDPVSREVVWTVSVPAHSEPATVTFQATVD